MLVARIPESNGFHLSFPVAFGRRALVGAQGMAVFVGCHRGLPLFCQSFGYAAGGATCSAGEEGTVNALGLNERRLLCAVAPITSRKR